MQGRRAWTVGVRGAGSPRESGLSRRIGADYQALQSDQGCTGLHGLSQEFYPQRPHQTCV